MSPDPFPTATLAGAVARHRERAERLLGELVACPSELGRTSSIDTVLTEELQAVGLTVERRPATPDHWRSHPEYSPPAAGLGEAPDALVATNGVPGAGLLLLAHTDTEPEHDGWDGDPRVVARTGDRVTGLGVADDKAGVVNVLWALWALADVLESAAPPPVRVVLAAAKQGGALGMLGAVSVAGDCSSAVYLHPAESGLGLAQLKVASRGVATLRIEVPGRTPEPREVRTPVSADPREGRSAAARAARLAVATGSWSTHELVTEVVGLGAGGAPFEVPATATFELACWFTRHTVAGLVADVTQRLAALAGDTWEQEHPPQVTAVGLRANPAATTNAAFLHRVGTAVEAVTGRRPEAYGWHGASDIRFPLLLLGVPAVGLGATAGDFYGPGEWVDAASWEATTNVVLRLLLP